MVHRYRGDKTGSSSTAATPGGSGAGKGRSARKALIAVIVVIVIVVAGATAYFLTRPSGTSQQYITIGTLYASSGSFALSSGYQLAGLKLWINQTNAQGGLMVSSLGKKLPLKLIALDDQSSTSTATTLYTNLITLDHVNILVGDFGSTLTAPAVAIAQEHHVLLFDPTASTPGFFTATNPYIVDLSILVSSEWPLVLAHYLISQKTNISRVAILYLDQAFTTAQAQTLDSTLVTAGITPVYYQSTSASSAAEYSTLLQSINATHPQAVLNFGYDTNDIAFYSALSANSMHFNFTFTIYSGLEYSLLHAQTPAGSLNYTYTYASPPAVQYTNVNLGPTTAAFVSNWTSTYGSSPNFNNIAGFNAGLLIGKTIETAGSLNQTAMRQAVNTLSGNTTTLEGPFVINTTTGAQIGMPMDLLQYQPGSSGLKPVVIYPTALATGTAVYPAPAVVVSSTPLNSPAVVSAESYYSISTSALPASALWLQYDDGIAVSGVNRN